MTTQLPDGPNIDIHTLSGIFRDCTNSYKFVWFLAILDAVQEKHEPRIMIDDLLAQIVATVWYPVNYFRLSFGKQDKLGQVVENLKSETGLPIDATPKHVVDAVNARPATSTARKLLQDRGRYVPFRFLRPFFGDATRGFADHTVNGLVRQLASDAYDSPSPPMYRFHSDSIELSAPWFEYLMNHSQILRGFCLWNFSQYLQSRNPNVCNVAGKLFAPIQRDLSDAKKFWQLVIEQSGPVKCIYSGALVDANTMSLDHFVPWSFIAHDELWNICPTTAVVNSSKSDHLPSTERHLRAFAQLQYHAVTHMVAVGKPKLLEDYSLLFRVDSLAAMRQLSENEFVATIEKTIKPQMQIARNCGFPADWMYIVNQ
jgi:hypothetical protein